MCFVFSETTENCGTSLGLVFTRSLDISYWLYVFVRPRTLHTLVRSRNDASIVDRSASVRNMGGQKELNTADFELRALKTSPRTHVSNPTIIGSRSTVFLTLHYKVRLVQLPPM